MSAIAFLRGSKWPMPQVNDPVLTVAQMQTAEQALVDAGTSIDELMLRAGRGAAEWVLRIAAGRAVTVLCGPGNNGGDGYVIAETLRERGLAVMVVAPIEPTTDAARNARAAWRGDLTTEGGGVRGAVLVDCLFGSGLSRPLSDELARLLRELAAGHAIAIAVDLPSGVESDSGALLNRDLPDYRLTIALGAWKFAHWLMPAAAKQGTRRLVEIGIDPVDGAAELLARPRLSPPASDAHKYTRGLVAVVGGPMEGAALLACQGAMRAGAGAVRLLAERLPPSAPPDIVLKRGPIGEVLAERRVDALLAGPGLGRGDDARRRLREALAANLPTVLDADALTLLDPADLAEFDAPLILTPHEGELDRLAKSFALGGASKLDRARGLADAARAVVVAKGPDTMIAAPDGRLVLAPSASSWLAVAGTGDVLAGIVASRLAAGGDPFVAACEGHWLHGEAARLAGPAFLASELAVRVGDACAATL